MAIPVGGVNSNRGETSFPAQYSPRMRRMISIASWWGTSP
jgi:hypothetical protein